eukprot:1638808-Rhodomonas_salina.1
MGVARWVVRIWFGGCTGVAYGATDVGEGYQVSAKYCAHCQEWYCSTPLSSYAARQEGHKDNDKRCKDGEEEEDYYGACSS